MTQEILREFDDVQTYLNMIVLQSLPVCGVFYFTFDYYWPACGFFFSFLLLSFPCLLRFAWKSFFFSLLYSYLLELKL